MSAAALAASVGVGAAVAYYVLRVRVRKPVSRVDLRTLRSEQGSVPERLKCDFYFDLQAAERRGCADASYLRQCKDVSHALDGLHDHIEGRLARARATALEPLPLECARGRARAFTMPGGDRLLCFRPERVLGGDMEGGVLLVGGGAKLDGGTFDLTTGSVWIGEGAQFEPGCLVRGPAIIGAQCVVRHGAYIRGDVVLGPGCVVGGELKHVLALEGCELPHHGYVGDSLLGYKAHLGCGAVTANFPLFPTSIPSVTLEDPGSASGCSETCYALGRRKFGAVLGDGSQLGCGSVTEPGCLVGPQTHAYPLSRLPRGCYGPNELLKNRPSIERAPLLARS
jgi:hypothetical protein